MRTAAMARVLAAQDPGGTDAAEGAFGTFMGAQPNGAYAGRAGRGSYADPELPWPASSDASAAAQERATALARVFHRAHAADWCAATTPGQLDALRARAADTTLDADSHAAACEACVEIARRHARVGTAASWDGAREPLCHFLAPAAPYVYASGTSNDDAARSYCSCP
jgi:hypothetical protein